jgi:hypothetical protein
MKDPSKREIASARRADSLSAHPGIARMFAKVGESDRAPGAMVCLTLSLHRPGPGQA